MNDNDHDAVEASAQAAEAMAQSLLDYARKLRAGEVRPSIFDTCAHDVRANLSEEIELLRERRKRQVQLLGPYVAEPALDLLLSLYSAYLDGHPLNLQELSQSASHSLSTAHRWLSVFANDGLVDMIENSQAEQLVQISEQGALRVSQALLG